MENDVLVNNDLYILLVEAYQASLRSAKKETERWHVERGVSILKKLKTSLSKVNRLDYIKFLDEQKLNFLLNLSNASNISFFFYYIDLYLETLNFVEGIVEEKTVG